MQLISAESTELFVGPPLAPLQLARVTVAGVAKPTPVRIEGDGLAWLSRSQVSADPTPMQPVALELAMRQPGGAAAYLARPCQYVQGPDARNCATAWWTDRRFAPEVVTASSLAIDQLKLRFSAQRLVLVGYSGGGAIAALVAAQRHDVALLVTVAGNLDTQAWTALNRITPLRSGRQLSSISAVCRHRHR